MNKARNIAVTILTAAMFYSFYLQPKDFQEAQCGSFSIKEGFDECWASNFRGPQRPSPAVMCWSAALERGLCGTDYLCGRRPSEKCMDALVAICEWAYPERP
jgi:hypothetical protein